MKIRDKILTILLSLSLSVSIYADKKEDDNGTNDPPPPPPNVQNEVESNPSPEDLQEQIDDLKDENEDLKEARLSLIKQRSEVLKDLAETQKALDLTAEDYSNVKKDLTAAVVEIKSLKAVRRDLIEELDEMGEILDKGPGSLFKGWVYSPELNWVYVSPSIVPYSFSQTDGWMLYEYGTDPRRVYYYNTKEWKILNEK
tara:strand:+ start:263 stop:859 length:597 start_codon:yes stop_codon:yes gene_type:complete